MADFSVPVVQINLHHSKSASILARRITEMQTAITFIQLWLLNNAIKSLRDCGIVFKLDTQNTIRTSDQRTKRDALCYSSVMGTSQSCSWESIFLRATIGTC